MDGDVSLSFVELAAEVERAARAFIAVGRRAGRPGGHLGAQLRRVGRRRARPAHRRRRARPAQHPLQGQGGGLRPRQVPGPSAVHGHRLPGHRLRGPARRGRRPGLAGGDDRPAGVLAATGTTPWADFLARADQVSSEAAADRAAGIDGEDTCDILFTSGTTGNPKGVMSRHAARHPGLRRLVRRWSACARVTATSSSTRSSTPSGSRPGILACLIKGATILPQPVFDVPTVMRAGRRTTASRCCPGRRRIYQTILNHPDLERFDMSSLRLAVTGAAAIPVEMIAAHARHPRLRDRRHRLRPDRVPRHRHHVPPRRRPRDHRHHLGPGHPRRRGPAWSTTTASRSPAASPARSSCGATT